MSTFVANALYYARRPFTYMGQELDRLQVLTLDKNSHKNEQLIRLRYFDLVEEGITKVQCGQCGKFFLSDEALTSHGGLRHTGLEKQLPSGGQNLQLGDNGPQMRIKEGDAFTDELERQHEIANRTTPLQLDKALGDKSLLPQVAAQPVTPPASMPVTAPVSMPVAAEAPLATKAAKAGKSKATGKAKNAVAA